MASCLWVKPAQQHAELAKQSEAVTKAARWKELVATQGAFGAALTRSREKMSAIAEGAARIQSVSGGTAWVVDVVFRWLADQCALMEFAASVWPLAQEQPDPAMWAGEF